MRTLVAFVLTAALYAQPPRPNPNPTPAELIDRLEKRVADGRSSVAERIMLVNQYFNLRNIEARRRHVLWLIEHNPETGQLVSPPASLDRNAPLPDPVGFAQADKLWREQVAKPGLSPKATGNAIRFFRFEDRMEAISILEAGERANPGDPDLAGWRGTLDAMAIGGVIMNPQGGYGSDHAMQRSPEAVRARKEIDSSSNAKLIGGAAQELADRYYVFADAPALNGQDALDLAEKLLWHARELEPENAQWKTYLSLVYEREAGQTADPKWKVQLFRKADAINPTWNGLPQLALAEFEASDDEAAARDAHRLLDRDINPPPNFAHIGHTVLGRIALAKGDVASAKAELLASVPIAQGNGPILEPNRTLAQDLLDHGEGDTVIQFLNQFREFWRNDQGSIDHYTKMIKAPGTHDILARYFAGQGLLGRPAPKLPIADYSGKVVAVQFRNASCNSCADDFAAADKIAERHGVAPTAIDQKDHEALVRQYEVEQFPTWVLIDRDGRIASYVAGRANEQDFERRIEQVGTQGAQQKLLAPESLAMEKTGTLAWSPVPGAESYVVQLDQRDEKGWLSDRGDHLVRVIPTSETSVSLDPALGETEAPAIRWRVFAVSRLGPGATSAWREIALSKP